MKFFFCSIAMVMADVTVLTDLWQEEEKRIKKLLETLGQKMKDHGVSILMKSLSSWIIEPKIIH